MLHSFIMHQASVLIFCRFYGMSHFIKGKKKPNAAWVLDWQSWKLYCVNLGLSLSRECCKSGHLFSWVESNFCQLKIHKKILKPMFSLCRLLIVDEIDYLVSKDRAILHELFELPAQTKSRCILIGELMCQDFIWIWFDWGFWITF